MKEISMKEIMQYIGKISFVSIDEVYEDRERIRKEFYMLPEDAQEVYKWYFYHQLCLMTQKEYDLKDLMWEYICGKNVELYLNHEYLKYKRKTNSKKNKS